MRLVSLALLLAACNQDITVTKGSSCNGEADGDEATVDAPFDADADGYFDAANPDCAATYPADRLDCDDQDPSVNPQELEATCNGKDDDCSDATPDGADSDSDGVDVCSDCNDADPLVSPSASEVSCNSIDDDCDEATPDSIDADGDGIDVCSDCNDGNYDINPTAAEVSCNGIDDDCDDATPDTADGDGDGASCDDCDDTDPNRSPTLGEACEDGVDNDCDGTVDEDCVIDYTGTWTLDDPITFSCASRNVLIDWETATISGPTSNTAVTASGAQQPGRMTGAFSSSTALSVSVEYAGGCTEDYYLDVEFSDANHFSGTFFAQYTPSRSGACADCTNQSWTISAYR